MQNLYITPEQLKNAAVANAADNDDVWELLAESVSRLFDRECEVSDGFFNAAGVELATRTYLGNGTNFVKVFPYVGDSITTVTVDGTDYFEVLATDRQYREQDGYLVFDFPITFNTPIDVKAIYGFSAIPAVITAACLEQALAMWRKKDLSFAEISGVSAAAVNAELSPSFIAITKRYRELYSSNSYFA